MTDMSPEDAGNWCIGCVTVISFVLAAACVVKALWRLLMWI